jgi:glycosyltransferase involved in cell wall biosynthesis
LEIRDLWPESIVAVGAMKRNVMIRCFEWLERFLYRRSDRIVAVTDAFKRHIVERGIPASRIDVIKNGARLPFGGEPVDAERLEGLRKAFDLEGKFVAAYVGTIGMAHRADILLEAAACCEDPDIVFMVVGTGAERARLESMQAERRLPNFRLIDKQPKEMIPYILALCDVSVVHLKDLPLFRTVIPSKIFEAMATHTPIVLGVEGETREIVDAAEAGLSIPPENAQALAAAVTTLKQDPELYTRMGENGFRYVNEHFDRRKLARQYWSVLAHVANGKANPDAHPIPA